MRPIERAKAPVENGLGGVAEILCRVGVSADKRDFLQGHPADIEPARVLAKANMHDDPARFGVGRGGRPGGFEPDTVDYKVKKARVREIGQIHERELRAGGNGGAARGIGLQQCDIRYTLRNQAEGGAEANGSTADHQRAGVFAAVMERTFGQTHRVPAAGKGLR